MPLLPLGHKMALCGPEGSVPGPKPVLMPSRGSAIPWGGCRAAEVGGMAGSHLQPGGQRLKVPQEASGEGQLWSACGGGGGG